MSDSSGQVGPRHPVAQTPLTMSFSLSAAASFCCSAARSESISCRIP